MTKLIIRTFLIGIFLSAGIAVAEAQESSELTAREMATIAALQNPGKKICIAVGVNGTFDSLDAAKKASYETGNLHYNESTCVIYTQK